VNQAPAKRNSEGAEGERGTSICQRRKTQGDKIWKRSKEEIVGKVKGGITKGSARQGRGWREETGGRASAERRGGATEKRQSHIDTSFS